MLLASFLLLLLLLLLLLVLTRFLSISWNTYMTVCTCTRTGICASVRNLCSSSRSTFLWEVTSYMIAHPRFPKAQANLFAGLLHHRPYVICNVWFRQPLQHLIAQVEQESTDQYNKNALKHRIRVVDWAWLAKRILLCNVASRFVWMWYTSVSTDQ